MIEISDQEALEFATWLRERGNQYLQRAERLERGQSKAAVNGTYIHQRTLPPSEPPRIGTVTQEQFEQSVTQKSGRIYDLARRLNVEESVIRDFLGQANAKVAIGGRGWIKPKNQIEKEKG